MEKNGSFDGLFLGALMGGAIGILAGLMLAPKAGKELRGDIIEREASFTERPRRWSRIRRRERRP